MIDDLSFSHFGNRITSAGDAALDTGEGFVEASNGKITKDDNKGLTPLSGLSLLKGDLSPKNKNQV